MGLFSIYNRGEKYRKQPNILTVFVHMHTLKNSWQIDCNSGLFLPPASF